MLFNSYVFALVFLPIAWIGFFTIGRVNRGVAALWLALASLFFYSWWDIRFLPLLLLSIGVNYAFGQAIERAGSKTEGAKRLLTAALVANLAALVYFKYFVFFVTNIFAVFGRTSPGLVILLPLGISFFTFTQIAYLVDTYQGKVRERNPVHYALFVTYFPHLIAGPVLHHAEMMPQFANSATYRPQMRNLMVGVLTFLIGLFKKVILADGFQPYVGPVFDQSLGRSLSPFEAWGAALAYTLQLYFDFSGYTDMAIGLSRMFNIELPQNFNSPYKASSIIDFWRRWHMTLSRFLRDYLYIPLGGNRLGEPRRYFNLFATMFLGGLWHGAGWTFVVWGTLHGTYLILNHGWRDAVLKRPWGRVFEHPVWRPLAWGLTFAGVVTAWVYFRALTLPAANHVASAMWGGGNRLAPQGLAGAPFGPLLSSLGFTFGKLPNVDWQLFQWVAVGLALALLLPNPQDMLTSQPFRRWLERDALRPSRPQLSFALGVACVAVVILLVINGAKVQSEFIYFNF